MEGAFLHDLPLPGLHLIEASAGTGKTTTLTNLFLRAILEGTEIDRILVVTFTESAAEEVKGRTHDLLVAARRRAMGDPVEGRLAPFLERVRPEHASLLSRALFDFDRATMTTIHAFCRRLLREYAFEFGSPFSLELDPDGRRANALAANEIWRRRVYPEAPEIALMTAAIFPEGPKSLGTLSSDALLYGECERACLKMPEEADDLRQRQDEWLGLLSECRRVSPESLDDLIRIASSDTSSKGKGRRKAKADEALPLPLLLRLRAIVTGVPGALPGWGLHDADLQEGLSLSSSGIHEIFSPVLRLLEAKEAVSASVRTSLRRDLLTYLRTEALVEREKREVETFGDMILRVLEGLLLDSSGELARRIRTRFPVAFVDEFQDTDLAQLRIFDRIYRFREGVPEEDGRRPSVFLVGDPKQSIYRFRGADIDAYLEAREQAVGADAGAIVPLSVNFRSDRRYVEAVNLLFSLVPDPFRTDGSIRYDPVRARHEGRSSFSDREAEYGGEAIPILFHPGDAEETLHSFASRCAREVERLVGGAVTIDGRPLRLDDIAVLVRQHSHGTRIHKALEERGILSVTYGTQSVFETEDAFDLEMLLLALAAPENRSQVRLVLASRFFGLTARDLMELEESQDLWNRRVDPLFRAAARWGRMGAMGTLRGLFLEQEIFPRLLNGPGGKRRVAHLLHLFELIDELGRDRPPLLLHVDRYLAARRETTGDGDERTAPRLEALDGRLRILTLHKAKGLEFPVVILPFGLPHTLRPGEEVSEGDREGELSEEMRLLYVALTRAKHRTVLLVPSARLPQPALGHLLGLALKKSYGKSHVEAFSNRLAALASDHPDLLGLLPEGGPAPLPPAKRRSKEPALSPPLISPVIRPARHMESFSSLLRRSLESVGEGDRDFRESDEGPMEGEWEGAEEEPVPAGPLFGTYFHEIMERLADAGPCSPDLAARVPEVLEEALSALGLSRDPSYLSWPAAIRPLIERTLSVNLAASSTAPFTLSGILGGDRAVEREFLLPVKGVAAASLGEFLISDGPRLSFDPVTGHLRGFIDLLFCHEERYYLLDYKTNRLGAPPGEDPYGPAGLEKAMAAHRYDLQGWLYVLALHRILGFSRPGYDYDRDFGGAIFLFARGLTGEGGRGLYRMRPPLPHILAFDHLLKGGSP